MTEELEIYFHDLTPEAQKRVLRHLNIKTPKEGNYDVFPLFILPKPES